MITLKNLTELITKLDDPTELLVSTDDFYEIVSKFPAPLFFHIWRDVKGRFVWFQNTKIRPKRASIVDVSDRHLEDVIYERT